MEKQKSIHIGLIIICFAFSVFQQGHNIGKDAIRIWDESVSAGNAVEMMANKSYWVVKYDCEPERYDIKPPLNTWIKVISYKFFGISEFSARFPTVVAYWLLSLFFVFLSIKLLRSFAMAWIVLILMACTKNFISHHIARTGDPDMFLMLFVAVYSFSYFILLEKYPKHFTKLFWIFSFGITAAVYTKSIQGLAPMAGPALYTFVHPNGRKLLSKRGYYKQILITVAMILFYYLTRELIDPGYIKAVTRFDLGMFFEGSGTIKHPEKEFYLNVLLFDRDPGVNWFFLSLPLIIIPLLYSENCTIKRFLIFSLISIVILFIGHNLSKTKNEWYLAPLYVFIWPLTAISYVESYNILINKFVKNNNIIRYIITLIFLFLLYGFAQYRYRAIFKKNHLPEKEVYEPEREADFFRNTKFKYPQIKHFTIITSQPLRSLKFYLKKYQLIDSTYSVIYKQVPKEIVFDTVCACQPDYRSTIENNFHFQIIDSNKYCRLYVLDSLKENATFEATLPKVRKLCMEIE